ncbi:MAG: Nucleotidyl transferase AbiEii toxin, Type IV TAsystem [Candidatus Argoarchaeum ethanivorans]|uniref:Nucleotidyl transferase AbiEii toxin, Type IV TAsystem n=1 Tax=Candidatus Argoarchaeum ethanivorans TaxID=2608793 RepID=A0A811ZYT0_9EURY|nr:MAG: Nucleotidyl transferase AbiEii toxin, Type IV TAsystem [Candidatus Argoarchaeum ethanivorans]
MQEKYYQNKLYPFQDRILKEIHNLKLDFYLTGGTALSRCYLKHRYSDDLDFFVNDHHEFRSQCNMAIELFKKSDWACDITTASDSFVRIFLEEGTLSMKVDFVNDVPFHFGNIENLPIFNQVDNWRNILSNKICALSRMEAKDIADIICIAQKYSFEWEDIIIEAKEKDLWVEPLEICKIIKEFPAELLLTIKWIMEINIDQMKSLIEILHDDIFYGKSNSLLSTA